MSGACSAAFLPNLCQGRPLSHSLHDLVAEGSTTSCLSAGDSLGFLKKTRQKLISLAIYPVRISRARKENKRNVFQPLLSHLDAVKEKKDKFVSSCRKS
ncbi:hypothetical protein CEXT_728251 [Caerostris extrusa]|uniref:Uncharacterized protein n=1 Tax=Caerostris extrusa TaxID=172846 RepID=A0AAV4P9Y5_CAEEX|nr:hypothetical protein CEXT_728251 [Caerostris extrusa]